MDRDYYMGLYFYPDKLKDEKMMILKPISTSSGKEQDKDINDLFEFLLAEKCKSIRCNAAKELRDELQIDGRGDIVQIIVMSCAKGEFTRLASGGIVQRCPECMDIHYSELHQYEEQRKMYIFTPKTLETIFALGMLRSNK